MKSKKNSQKKEKEKEKEKNLLNNKTKRSKKTNLNVTEEDISNTTNLNIAKIPNDISIKPNNNFEFTTDPKEIIYSTPLIEDLYDNNSSYSENLFLIFKSVDDKYYLIYISKSLSIIIYNIFSNTKILEIKINKHISCFNHYSDYKNKRDLIMTIEAAANNIKVYNYKDWSLIQEYNKINKSGYLNTACFYNDINNNEIYILTSNHRFSSKNVDPIKIYDLKGNKIKEVKESNENISFLDSFYDKKTNNNFIIAAFTRYIKAYNYNNNSVYKVYKDKYNPFHRNVIINENDKDITKLIESSVDGYIRIWDFHKGELIKRIQVDAEENKYHKGAFGICLWNNDYLFVGIYDKIILVNINDEKENIISKLTCKNTNYDNQPNIIAIKKIKHPKFGECLLSKGYDDGKILLWTNKKQ